MLKLEVDIIVVRDMEIIGPWNERVCGGIERTMKGDAYSRRVSRDLQLKAC